MKRKTIEQTIRDNSLDGIVGSEFVLRVSQVNEDGSLNFSVRPNNRDGETRDYVIKGNKIKHNFSVKY